MSMSIGWYEAEQCVSAGRCEASTCFNGGQCDETGERLCRCPVGFKGTRCQYGEFSLNLSTTISSQHLHNHLVLSAVVRFHQASESLDLMFPL